MRVVSNALSLQKTLLKLKQKGQRIGFVPTMGCLHEGHLSLIKMAQKKSDVVVVSIFVNPLQFGPHEDFAQYPQTLQSDLLKLKALKVDYVLTPQTDSFYPQNFQTQVHVGELADVMCGPFRPGHFDGVATVVLKLFQIVQPDIAVFGKKDYQQYLVVKQMAKDFNLPIQIFGAPTVREKDGLAMSSRNLRLSVQQREIAQHLSETLFVAKSQLSKKVQIDLVKKNMWAQLTNLPQCKVEYVEICSALDLSPLKKYVPKQSLIALAVRVGTVRLIDNIIV